MAGETKLSGPDLAEEGLPLEALDSDIPSVGHFDGKAVVVLQTGTVHAPLAAPAPTMGALATLLGG